MGSIPLAKVLVIVMAVLIYQTTSTQDNPDVKKKGVDIMITQSPKIIVKVEAVTHNICHGESKGAINMTPSGGYPLTSTYGGASL
jgi:hypothetical protein